MKFSEAMKLLEEGYLRKYKQQWNVYNLTILAYKI